MGLPIIQVSISPRCVGAGPVTVIYPTHPSDSNSHELTQAPRERA
jgi:hypothetical protein